MRSRLEPDASETSARVQTVSERLAELPPDVVERMRRVQAVVLDVDGVLTDGGIDVDAEGRQSLRFHVRDGSGIWLAHRAGIRCALVTGRGTGIPTHYAKTLPIDLVLESRHDKRAALDELAERWELGHDAIAYVADDVIDAPALHVAGLAVCVADATPDLHRIAHLVTRASGGRGAVREAIDLIVEAQGRRDALLARFLAPEGDAG